MKIFVSSLLGFRSSTAVLALFTLCGSVKAQDLPIPNRLIDYPAFLANASEVQILRHKNRVTEKQFLEMSAESGTVVLDARSDEKFKMAHFKGALHLSLPDVTAEELAKLIPDKGSRILIYCNNNFRHQERALPNKAAPASLNIYTFNTLFSYGYKNVYELGPLIDFDKTILPFEGTEVTKK